MAAHPSLPPARPPSSGPALLLLFLFSLGAYLAGLDPSLFRNDSPETITVCSTLGISHPPSYPLHTLVGHLFSALPIGNPAFPLNFFSAVLGAWGLCLLALLLRRVLPGAWEGVGPGWKSTWVPDALALLTALAFGFSRSYWSASLSAKGGIFILQTDLELLLLLCLLDRAPGRGGRDGGFPLRGFLGALFVLSLGLTNNWPTQLLLFPPALVVLWTYRGQGFSWVPGGRTPRTWMLGGNVLLLGLTPYLYLPLRSNLHPVPDWNSPFTFHRFWVSVLRLQYSGYETLLSTKEGVTKALGLKARYISDHLLGEYHPVIYFLALTGVFLLRRTLRGGMSRLSLFLLLVLATTWTANEVYFFLEPIQYWHIDDHLLTFNWVFGLALGASVLGLSVHLRKRPQWVRALFLSLLGGGVLGTWAMNWPVNDQKREFLYRGYGILALRSLERGGVYFTEEDYDYFSVLYLMKVEGKRKDVLSFHSYFLSSPIEYERIRWAHPGLLLPGELPQDPGALLETLRGSLAGRPFYSTHPDGYFTRLVRNYGQNLSFRPEGILAHLDPTGPPPPPRLAMDALDELWDRYLRPGRRSLNPIDANLRQICAEPFTSWAEYLHLRGSLDRWDELYSKALGLLQDSAFKASLWERKAEGDLWAGRFEKAEAAYLESSRIYTREGYEDRGRWALRKAAGAATQRSPAGR